MRCVRILEGATGDIMIHMIETARKIFGLPPVKYYFFETGLEMEAAQRQFNDVLYRDGGGKWRKLQSDQIIARSDCPARWFSMEWRKMFCDA